MGVGPGSFDFSKLPNQDNPPNLRLYQPYVLDMETGESLVLQTVPLELEYDTTSNWAAIASMGRNNPMYQYTSGEDTLSFQISWYSNEESRKDVLSKCKWLESLSKNDGYNGRPHRVKLIWGELFTDTLWVVVDAKYKLSMFQRHLGMLPALAIQGVTLKRLSTENRTLSQIRKTDT